MSIFKNKHVRIALVLAPILGVVSYYVTRDLGSEDPHAAREGQSYQLAAKPNCRRASGLCELKNGEFELTLTIKRPDEEQARLMLSSVFPLDGVMVALFESDGVETQPEEMQRLSEDGLQWLLEMKLSDPETDRLHLVASANGSLYYGDAAMKFTLQENGSEP